ncbi:Mur ligase [Clostridia bacterium]|nr:Mur ligase [Clostridia bacterium]
MTSEMFFPVYLAVSGIITVLFYLKSLHTFQLEGYSPSGKFRRRKKNGAVSSPVGIALYGTLPFMAIYIRFFPVLALLNLALGIAWIVYGISGFPFVRKKKPLRMTWRVRRLTITAAVIAGVIIAVAVLAGIMTKAGGILLFIVLPGIAGVLPETANLVNRPVEKSIEGKFIREAANIIDSRPDLITIGVTGSYGKTSLKYFLTTILSRKYSVLMTPESFNTTMGVVKTVRESLTADTEIFVCEMGAKKRGEIKEICDIVKPGAAVITAIGPQHLESFGSIEDIISTKFELAEAVPPGGTVFLNYGNEYIAGNAKKANTARALRIVPYAFARQDNTRDVNYAAGDVTVSENGTAFSVNGYRFETALLGRHNVENVTGAIAAAAELGMSFDEIALGVRRLESPPHRLQLIRQGDDILIDDAFNSNPAGTRAALEVLMLFRDSVKILITPGMIELGGKQAEENNLFAKAAAGVCDMIILIGEKQTEPMAAGLKEVSYPAERYTVQKTFSAGIEFARKIIPERAGQRKVILIENDLPDNF